MIKKVVGRRFVWRITQNLLAVFCSGSLAMGSGLFAFESQPLLAGSAQQEAAKVPADQLDSLVAPIALYPDPLLAQVLAASTYPLEIIQLQQWLQRHKDLKDKALEDAVQKEDWDPSIQAMAALPDVVDRLANDIKWTTDLGNAFLAQQADVMDAVQRMRRKAQDNGNLKSTEQQKVETQVVESKTVVVIQQANPQVVYVPTYNPVVVYGPPIYPYPPIYYPPPGYYAAGMAISFGVGVAMGAAWGGGWGWGCGWGHSNVNINVNNNYVKHYNNTNVNNINNINRPANRPAKGNTNWQHNPQHRGGAPYGDRATATQYGGTARGDSTATRQANARQNQAQTANRAQSGTRPSQGQLGGQQPGAANRASAGGANSVGANRPTSGGASNAAANRPAGGGTGNTAANRPASSGGDRIANRSVSPTPSAGTKGGAFNGASSGSTGKSTVASSQRGASSMGAARSAGAGSAGRRR